VALGSLHLLLSVFLQSVLLMMSQRGQGIIAGLCLNAAGWFAIAAIVAGVLMDYDMMSGCAILAYLFAVLAVIWAWDLQSQFERDDRLAAARRIEEIHRNNSESP